MTALFTYARIALTNLVEHRRRTALLTTAIALVAALFVLLSSLIAGIRHTLLDTATTLSSGHVNVGGFYKATSGQAMPIVSDYRELLARIRAETPELAFTVQRGRGWGRMVSDQGTLEVGLNGVDIASEPAFQQTLTVVSGRLADLASPGTVLVFEHQAKKLDLRVGDAVTLSSPDARGVANTLDCRVAVIAKEVGLLSQWNVFLPNDSLRTLYRLKPTVTGVIQVHMKPEHLGDLQAIAARTRQTLEAAGLRVMPADPRPFWMKFPTVIREAWTGQGIDVTTWEDELSFMTWTIDALKALSSVLLFVLLAIVVTGIMNTLWIAIRERTREIGTLRALGVQRPEIASMFLLEAILLGALGALVGATAGALSAALLNSAALPVPTSVQLFLMRDTLKLVVEPATIGGALLLMPLLTGLSALYPSLRASRLTPVDAMAHI